MAKSTETSSAKSSIISGKAASLKRSVQKGAKAAARPFKKLKQSLSTSSRSLHSRSSTTLPQSDNEAGNTNDNASSHCEDVHNSDSEPEPEPELTPEQELGM